ncbi:hypothetical protein SAMN06296036_14715 [Pseudobacteriovorax antillogorgiicola]|uniref:Helix-turn-helix n=1 Tax=Pseudobacteriovorax antillogorgiicola TaxID=1513793 RepID=A0A1Y6CWE9_9BACT|nr:hypothetical protein EDD56_1466 [Pseudobacteriovorax antillogorgiicola]SMF83499.1 hypothetical protein SAMN06296036_14715 [Pseudobacteriovorax antillogorgiicola]
MTSYCSKTLVSELKRRRKKNPSYSLRKFAKDLSIDPGYLSRVLRDERAMSLDMVYRVGRKLFSKEKDIMSFVDGVYRSKNL